MAVTLLRSRHRFKTSFNFGEYLPEFHIWCSRDFRVKGWIEGILASPLPG